MVNLSKPVRAVDSTCTYHRTTSAADSYGQATTDWDIDIDDLFFTHGLAEGETCAVVTGLVHYSYGEYVLAPRTEDDLDN